MLSHHNHTFIYNLSYSIHYPYRFRYGEMGILTKYYSRLQITLPS